jgi:transposase-like protein
MPKARGSYASDRRWTVGTARTVLAAQARSGLSVAAFAAREGVDPQRLYFWRRRLDAGSETGRPAFIEVRPAAIQHVEIVLRSGQVVRVAESIDAVVLRRLIEALDQDAPC